MNSVKLNSEGSQQGWVGISASSSRSLPLSPSAKWGVLVLAYLARVPQVKGIFLGRLASGHRVRPALSEPSGNSDVPCDLGDCGSWDGP